MATYQIVLLVTELLESFGPSQILEMGNVLHSKSYLMFSKVWLAPNASFVSSKWCVSLNTITSSLAWISFRYVFKVHFYNLVPRNSIIPKFTSHSLFGSFGTGIWTFAWNWKSGESVIYYYILIPPTLIENDHNVLFFG